MAAGRWKTCYFLLTFVLVLTFVSLAGQLPQTLNYKLDLKIDYNQERLFSQCEITFLNSTKKPVLDIPLLLYRLLKVKKVEGENGAALTFAQNIVSISGWEKIQVNFIKVSLDKILAPGEQRKIKLAYEGYLLGYSEAGWGYVKDHIDKAFTIIRTDGFGYPMIGYPNIKDMMAIAKERYGYSIKITVPKGLTAATGGKLIDRIQHGKETTFMFINKKPSWRMDIAVSDFQHLRRGKNEIYYFPGDRMGAEKIMTALEASHNLYKRWFGPLDSYPGFSILEVPKGYGSQMDVAAFIITADNFKKQAGLESIYHEVAHLWNVKSLDPLPCRWESEGFAQFHQFLLLEKLENRKKAVAGAADRYLDKIRTAFKKKPEYQAVPIRDYGIKDMTNYSYTLGMVVFAIFHNLVGSDHFNKIIGTFYTGYHAKGATLDEFVRHCRKLSPVDLKIFFDDWIYSTRGIRLVMQGKTYPELLKHYKKK